MKYSATPIVMESETSKTKLFSWIGVVFNAKEVELLELGLDTVVFLRFMRMISWSLTVIALVCGGALIPINVVYNFNNVPESKRSALSMLTIQDVKGNILFIHMGVSYVVSKFEILKNSSRLEERGKLISFLPFLDLILLCISK